MEFSFIFMLLLTIKKRQSELMYRAIRYDGVLMGSKKMTGSQLIVYHTEKTKKN